MSLADIDKARRCSATSPTIRLEEGLGRAHRHFAEDASLLPEIRERRRWLSLAR